MSGKWFSNRGQILQISIAFVALVVGILVAFPRLPVQQGFEGFVVVWPIIVFPSVALGLMWLNNNRIHRAIETLVQKAPSSAQTAPPAPEPLKTSRPSASPALAKIDTSEPRWETDEVYVVDVKVRIGGYWDEPDSRSKIRVSVLSLKGADPGKQAAELQFKYGGIVFHGGSDTESVAVNRYIVPLSSSGFQSEERCVHEFSFSDEHIQFLVIRLDAIDTAANEVVLNIAKFRTVKRPRL